MLPVVILLALKRFEIEEISYWWLSSCVSWTCIQGVGEDRGIAIAWTFLMGLWLGSSNVEKCGDHWRKKFFINNPVQALIPFKEKHQGLLKLHVPLGWDWGKGGRFEYGEISEFSLKLKNNQWGGFLQSIEILFIFWRVFGEF